MVMTQQAVMQVWVAYASSDHQYHIALDFKDGMTVADAIEQSGLANKVQLPEPLQVGIFGSKIDDVNHVLEAGDRVEIYRVLTINPKDIRRNRAKANPVGLYCRGNRFKQLK